MLYPVYVHVGDDQYAHSVTIPDFPGCFSAADEWDDLPANIQEAVELHIDGYAAQHNMKRSGFMVAAALKAARGD